MNNLSQFITGFYYTGLLQIVLTDTKRVFRDVYCRHKNITILHHNTPLWDIKYCPFPDLALMRTGHVTSPPYTPLHLVPYLVYPELCITSNPCIGALEDFATFYHTLVTVRTTPITHTHTHTHAHAHTHVLRLTRFCQGLPGWASSRKVKPIWILLKQETVIGSGISCAICKSAPHPRQITMPLPHH